MKIKILKNTVCGGEKVRAGDIVDASERDAAILIGYKKAEKTIEEPAVEVAVEEPTEQETADAESEEPKAATKSKAKRK